MIKKSFKRSLKLPVRKHATEGKPVELAPLPKSVTIPINQHFGAPNKAVVNVGDYVKRGQKIADAVSPGIMTVPVHASISGIVKKIEPRTQSNNVEGLCIIIEAAGNVESESEDQPATLHETLAEDIDFLPPLDPANCTPTQAKERIREAGIIGMGGAGFPAHIKLSPPPEKQIDFIITNGAECEPYLTIDDVVMNEKPGLMVTGLEIAMKIAGVKKAIIGIEDNKKELVPIFERELEKAKIAGVSVALCRTRYPQGGEKMLITALTGREVPSGGLPMDAGCIVQNAGTLIAIAEAFVYGKPLIDRDLTVSGGACRTPKNIRIPIGSSLSDLPSDFMDIDYSKLVKIIFGGPMMGFAVSSLDIPIQKNTSGIILMTAQETIAEAEGPCIRCGRCMRKCPLFLTPVIINNSLEVNDLDYAVKAGLLDCMECGSCTYVCPARIKLVQRFRVGKQRFRMKA